MEGPVDLLPPRRFSIISLLASSTLLFIATSIAYSATLFAPVESLFFLALTSPNGLSC